MASKKVCLVVIVFIIALIVLLFIQKLLNGFTLLVLRLILSFKTQ